MIQLKLYITLLRHNCAIVDNQALEELYNSNPVFVHDRDSSIIFLDGDWWGDFVTSHTFGVCNAVMIQLRTKFKANRLHIVYRNQPIACFTWDDDAKMYLGKNGGYYNYE